jgi:hypothetical protein
MEKSKVLAALLKTAEKDSDRIVNLYALAEYSQHPLREHEKTEAIRAWQRLSWRLRLAELWGRIIKRAGVKSS